MTKVTENKDNFLITTSKGEYHFTKEEYLKLGADKALEKAIQEIDKKLKSDYQDATIDFSRAREIGFCEYGINDFCEQLGLDVKGSYTILELADKLTVDVFLEYTDECSKLFGKDKIMAKFGGVKNFLKNNRTRSALNFVLEGGFIPDKQLHLLACDFAENVLPIFEKEYPEDNRPRRAIEVKRLWIGEEYKSE